MNPDFKIINIDMIGSPPTRFGNQNETLNYFNSLLKDKNIKLIKDKKLKIDILINTGEYCYDKKTKLAKQNNIKIFNYESFHNYILSKNFDIKSFENFPLFNLNKLITNYLE